jgi:hypothetical protein
MSAAGPSTKKADKSPKADKIQKADEKAKINDIPTDGGSGNPTDVGNPTDDGKKTDEKRDKILGWKYYYQNGDVQVRLRNCLSEDHMQQHGCGYQPPIEVLHQMIPSSLPNFDEAFKVFLARIDETTRKRMSSTVRFQVSRVNHYSIGHMMGYAFPNIQRYPLSLHHHKEKDCLITAKIVHLMTGTTSQAFCVVHQWKSDAVVAESVSKIDINPQQSLNFPTIQDEDDIAFVNRFIAAPILSSMSF